MAKNKPKPQPDTDFFRLFDLPGYNAPLDLLMSLGAKNGPMFDNNLDQDDNPGQEPAGFTYWWQSVDHDNVRTQIPLGDMPIDISSIVNFRTPSLDLDSVLGGGPQNSPHLYSCDGRIILSLNGRDIQRDVNGRAVIMDDRNDENQVLLQIHVAIARFYNAMISMGFGIEKALKMTRQHYHYVIWNDALPRVIDRQVLDRALDGDIGIFDPGKKDKASLPIEFVGALFRVFHSNVRRAYVTGVDQLKKTQVFNPAQPGNDLTGFRPLTEDKVIQWSNFFPIQCTTNPQPPVNVSRKMDILLSSGLFDLPAGAIGGVGPVVLAQRNLIRGKQFGLPSGQALADALDVFPIFDNNSLGLSDPRWNGEAPLWYYALSEAVLTTGGRKMGPMASLVNADVIVGLLKHNKQSIFKKNKLNFDPLTGTDFKIGDFLKIAGVA